MDHQINEPALINCPACNSQVSNQAVACPQCGQPISVYNAQPLHQVASQPPTFRQQKKPLTQVQKGGLGCLGFIVLIIIISCLLQGNNNNNNGSNSNTNYTAQNQTDLPRPSPSTSSLDTNSPDYRAGYIRGLQKGKDWVKDFPNGITPPQALITTLGKTQAEKIKPQNPEVWQSGWDEGFVKGYKVAKWKGRNEEDYEQLTWSNAKTDVKLYDDSGKLRMTIVSVDQATGIITVKYPKENGGVIENKSLDAMSAILLVRKDDPALNR